MKRCPRCQETLSDDRFNRNKRNKDGLSSYCSECQRTYNREHYEKRPDYYKDKAKKRLCELIEWVNAKKDVPCADCGRRWPPVAMDFDHRDGEKKAKEVSLLVRDGVTKRRLEREIAKCDVVCACCHRLRTEKRHHALVA
jgi:hypothetical protein